MLICLMFYLTIIIDMHVLVDMAGSENIDQAGFVGPEEKERYSFLALGFGLNGRNPNSCLCSALIFPASNFQPGKINQGNIALQRVVESIANGDSHVPYRDIKLTMLLQVPPCHIHSLCVFHSTLPILSTSALPCFILC